MAVAKNPPRTSRLVELLWHALPPALYILLVWLLVPFQGHFQLDFDEGGNLMKGFLLLRGYPLYTEIWSDQPPLFTYLLAGVFRFAGPSLTAGRLLVLLFGGLLVWAAVQTLRRVWGGWAAVLGFIFLILLPAFVRLSVSVMIGLPAIALALAALYFLVLWRQERRAVWLALSGALLALSLFTKLFTAFLAPLFVLGLLLEGWLERRPETRWRWLRPALVWGAGFGVICLLLGSLLLGAPAGAQLLFSHLEARQAELYAGFAHLASINYHLQPVWPLLALAGSGALLAMLHKRWLALYLASWALAAYALLFNHRPVWEHLQLLVTVPAALLAAGAVAQAGEMLAGQMGAWRRGARAGQSAAGLTWAGIVALALLLYLVGPLPAQLRQLRDLARLDNPLDRETSAEFRILRKMEKFAPETAWVVTDLPLYAFLIQRPAPPALAVISDKRMVTGELDEAAILAEIRAIKPEQILFGRFQFPGLEAALQPDYRLAEQRGDMRLYLRAGLE